MSLAPRADHRPIDCGSYLCHNGASDDPPHAFVGPMGPVGQHALVCLGGAVRHMDYHCRRVMRVLRHDPSAYHSPRAAPSFRAPKDRQVRKSMDSLTKWMLPSHMPTLTPPE